MAMPRQNPLAGPYDTVSLVAGLYIAFQKAGDLHARTIGSVMEAAFQYNLDRGLMSYVSPVWLFLCGWLIFAVVRFVMRLGFSFAMKHLLDVLTRNK